VTFLVVDELPLARSLIREALEADGYDCRVAGTVAEAAQLVASEGIDGIVLSLPPHGTADVTWLERVSRKLPSVARQTVVMASADLGGDERRRIASIGALLLLRPFSLVTLLSVVSDMMAPSPGPVGFKVQKRLSYGLPRPRHT
jgi:DNA-binding response OmpR family regulator